MNKKIVSVFVLIFAAIVTISAQKNIGCQAYSFKDFSLQETLEHMETLNIRTIEMYPKQQFTPTDNSFTTYKMPKNQIASLKAMLKKHKVKVTSYGVISLRKKEDWIQLFEFAKEMGIKTIVTEPHQDQFSIIDELCQKYKIYASIHNHAKPKSPWGDPADVKEELKNRSKYMKVCADIGHWKRSNLDVPNSLKLLEGKIFELHVKDVSEPSLTAKIVPLGEGVINWKGVFKELKRQNFKGNYIIEHTANKTDLMEHMQHNLEFLKNHFNGKKMG
jgi:sugar phosphate isomerase/epimerase